jgi:hypothetical protein
MILENDPSARMQLRSMGELVHPAACCVCGNGVCEAGYIDLGVYYDYEGQMYLCKTCLYQAGETFGMFTPDEVKIIQDQLVSITNENEKLKEELEELERVRPIVSVIESGIAAIAATGDVPTVPAYESYEPGDGSTGETSEGSVSGESEVTEHADSERRTDTSGSEQHNFTFQ